MVDESKGIKVVYRSNLHRYLDNTVIDYRQNMQERGFVIRGSHTSYC